MAKIETDGSLQLLSPKLLHLDSGNPRFGGRGSKAHDEAVILNEIVLQHGITDVLSSIAANGFFESEPLVGAINKSHGAKITIVEGNRRLSACLVIIRDKRAEMHSALSDNYQTEKFDSQTKVPVQVFDWAKREHKEKLLPYLGIRHIVGAAQWDSYAKAAWVAMTLRESQFSIDQIRKMIGDDQKFIDRIVEGYYFVNQALDENAYDAKESLRNGRGSFQEFPFSWVYTALGYKSVRNFLGLPAQSVVDVRPIPAQSRQNAGKLLRYMFGSSGRNAAINDSRNIGMLAQALCSADAVTALDAGKSAQDAISLLRPADQRLTELMMEADATIATCVAVASGFKSLDRATANKLLDQAERIANRVEVLYETLEKLESEFRASTKRRRSES